MFLKGIVMNKKRVFDVSTMIIAALTCVGTELQGMAPAQAGKTAVAVLSDNSAFKEAENIINSASYWWQFKSSVFNAAFRSAREGQVDKAKKEQLTTKAKNIWGGIKATPKVIKTSFKKVDNK